MLLFLPVYGSQDYFDRGGELLCLLLVFPKATFKLLLRVDLGPPFSKTRSLSFFTFVYTFIFWSVNFGNICALGLFVFDGLLLEAFRLRL